MAAITESMTLTALIFWVSRLFPISVFLFARVAGLPFAAAVETVVVLATVVPFGVSSWTPHCLTIYRSGLAAGIRCRVRVIGFHAGPCPQNLGRSQAGARLGRARKGNSG